MAAASLFGTELKEWRRRRRMSQLDLALAANVSARHLAFLETGRSRPSRSMVMMLAEALEMPRPARNELLGAAGFAPLYRARDLSESDMAMVRAAIDWTLSRHDPLPGFAIDRHWKLVATNLAAGRLFASIGADVGDSLLNALVDDGPLRAAIVNWPTVARYVASRLRIESIHLGGDPVLEAAMRRLDSELGVAPDETRPLPPFIPTVVRLGDATLSFFSTIAHFGTAEDITIADVKIELMFPTDEATRIGVLRASENATGTA